MDPAVQPTPQLTPQPEQLSSPVDTPHKQPEPLTPPELPEPQKEILFASLYQQPTTTSDEEEFVDGKLDSPEKSTETSQAENEQNPQKEDSPSESNFVCEQNLIKKQEQFEKKLNPQQEKKIITPEAIAPQKVAQAPRNVATDEDIPMAFEGGVHTTQLTERDSLFHRFIKAVNIALYNSMRESTPPFSPGIQPVVVRMVIVRTGKLAQRPTMVRSSGNQARDNWFIEAIVRASAAFPQIPEALRLPFAEMYFKEGTRGVLP